MSPSASTVVVAPERPFAASKEPARVTVTVRDDRGRALDRHVVRLEYAGAGLVDPAEQAVVDGVATFEVSAPAPTSGVLVAVVDPGPGAIALASRPTLAFIVGSRVGGTVSGLDRGGLVLSSPGLPDLSVASGATAFTFGSPAVVGAPYQVAVASQPHGLVCEVRQGHGVVPGSDVADVQVICGQGWSAVAAGGGQVLALKVDGSLWAWGWNNAGQVGDGTLADRYLPRRIGAVSDWTAISTGGQFSQALRADGSRWVWGWNGGQFGDGGAERSLVPRRMPDAGPWTFLATGFNHTLGIDGQGWLWGWGLNFSAQLGDGTQVDRPAPVRIGGDAVWAVASPGDNTSHAILADGTLWGWGVNQSGQVGDGRADVAMRLAPVRVGADADWVAAASATEASLGLKRDGTLWSWGRDGCGGGRSDQIMWVPTRVGAEADWQAIAAGRFHCAALRADGTLWAWGMNLSGQLGTTRYVPSPAPQRIGSRSDWVAVAAGYSCTFAVGRGGDLWAWGLGCLGWPNQLEAPIYEAGVEVVAPGE